MNATDHTADTDPLEESLAMLAAASRPMDGAAPDTAKIERARGPFRALSHAVATHLRLAISLEDLLAEMSPEDREKVRAAMAKTVLDLWDEIDTAEAGRTITAFSAGINALRPDKERFRAVADNLIARYLTTGQYHDSHEGFVTLSLLAEQYLYAMADATTVQHDILDDAVSSNTRTVANLVRGLGYYGRRIAEMPESSYRNAGRVLVDEAEPEEAGKVLTAVMTMHNRLAAASPGAQRDAVERLWRGIDPAVLEQFTDDMIALTVAGISANPKAGRVLARSAAKGTWKAVKAVFRSLLPRRKHRVASWS